MNRGRQGRRRGTTPPRSARQRRARHGGCSSVAVVFSFHRPISIPGDRLRLLSRPANRAPLGSCDCDDDHRCSARSQPADWMPHGSHHLLAISMRSKWSAESTRPARSCPYFQF